MLQVMRRPGGSFASPVYEHSIYEPSVRAQYRGIGASALVW